MQQFSLIRFISRITTIKIEYLSNTLHRNRNLLQINDTRRDKSREHGRQTEKKLGKSIFPRHDGNVKNYRGTVKKKRNGRGCSRWRLELPTSPRV